MFLKKRIYLDFASITPIDKSVSKEMRRAEKFFANPSSLYIEGGLAKKEIEKARKSVATLLRAFLDEIFFTSGGTEGNNIAILGTYFAVKDHFQNQNKIPHLIVSSIEHSSVLECARYLETQGVRVSYLKPKQDGIIDIKDLKELLCSETFLVSIHFANNEIGVVEPIYEIAKQIRHFKKEHNSTFPYFHTDACQAFNYINIDILLLHIDLLTLDGSKVYGPRGIGILYKKRGLEIKKLIFGGGQEKDLRSGTENIQSILGIKLALEIAHKKREKESERLKKIQDYFLKKLKEELPESIVNGSKTERLPNNINFAIPDLDSEFTVFQMDAEGVAVSSASSCLNNKEDSFSYVVREINPGMEKSAIRVSLGSTTKYKDVDSFFRAFKKILKNNLFFKSK